MFIDTIQKRDSTTLELRRPAAGTGLGIVLLGLVLAACSRDEAVPVVRHGAAAPTADSCEDSATAALGVLAVDPRGAPVVGAKVTLSVEGAGNGAISISNRQGMARFAAVAACSSLGIWVTTDAAASGFVQVVLPPGAANIQKVTVRPGRSPSAPEEGA